MSSIHIHGLDQTAVEEWMKYAQDIGILFQDEKPTYEDFPILLTRYTLDNMDSAWNKLLEND